MDATKKRLLAGALALLPLATIACGEDVAPPPPTGSVAGQVSIEGRGADGVSVTLSSGAVTTTAGGGSYRFDDLEPGSYTVSISGFPAEASFDATSMPVTVGETGGTATVDFSGSYIRTASVRGSVTVEGDGLSGVAVRLSGMSDAQAMTDASGQYSFTGLRAGRYAVEISGFDSDEVGFSSTSGSADLGVGDTEVVSFDGTYLRTAGIRGQVSVEGSGLAGVTVSLSGEGDDRTATTDAGGQYAFSKLRAGDYSVAVSGYDMDAIGFDATSQSVTVALGETANVRFDGAYLRTSGVVGQVSVAGMGISGVAVTLASADMDSMTDTTDASGFYSFSALAAGDYTVSIMVASEAYVFSTTSMDVTLADDESATVNFRGEHATTASVSGMLFVDEATKNDMHDQGEDALEIAGVPLVLVGPAVGDQMSGMTDERGMFEFSGLRAGTYALAVVSSPTVATMLGDYAYGGPATGYQLDVAVGQKVMQRLPYDITHQTVHYTVTLRHGDTGGDTLAGATVTLYADEDGDSKIASADTDADGMASIRFARSMATGSMVWASVSSDDYTVEADAMQKIEWNAKSKMAMAMNDFDVLNLMVDAKISGATIMTDMGGGKPLADWAISVMMGGSMVDGAPTKLGADGTAMFKTTAMASDLPAMYTVMLDSTQADKLDGGETFSSTPVTIEHSGLELMETMDADMLEAMWTTQTLTVYVHHEMDQAEGYTGSVLGGDERMSGKIDVDVRYIDELGRSRMFASDVWDPKNKSDKNGVISFKKLPADAQVMVSAKEASTATDVMLLDPAELFAFRDADANGIVKGAFGDHGGFSPTVELCPLMATEPAGQDFGECGTFAYVMKYGVSGTIGKKSVKKSGEGFGAVSETPVAGVTVGLTPVAGKNLAGMEHSQTTAKANAKATTWDDRNAFDFGKIAAGVYKLAVPAGWQAMLGAKGSTTKLGDALSPLDTAVMLDVTPTTTVVYGFVTGKDKFPVDSVMVDVNGMTAMTDDVGRYIVEGVSAKKDSLYAKGMRKGFSDGSGKAAFTANSPTQIDFVMGGSGDPVFYSGKVVASGSNAPIAGVEIKIDGNAPENAVKGKLVTGADGTFRAQGAAKSSGTVAITAKHADYTFAPASLPLPATSGTDISGANFTGFLKATVRGRVVRPQGDGPEPGVWIKARKASDTAMVVDSMKTGSSGTFRLKVPFGDYDIRATKSIPRMGPNGVEIPGRTFDGFGFDYPNGSRRVSVAPGQNKNFGKIQTNTWMLLDVMPEWGTFSEDSSSTILSVGSNGNVTRGGVGGLTGSGPKEKKKSFFYEDTYILFSHFDRTLQAGRDYGIPEGHRMVYYDGVTSSVNGRYRSEKGTFGNDLRQVPFCPVNDILCYSSTDTSMTTLAAASANVRKGAKFEGHYMPNDTFTIVAVVFLTDPSRSGNRNRKRVDTAYMRALVPARVFDATSVTARRSLDGDTVVLDWDALTAGGSTSFPERRLDQRVAVTFPSVAALGGINATLYFVPSTDYSWNVRRVRWRVVDQTFQMAGGGGVSVTKKEMEQDSIAFRIDYRFLGEEKWSQGTKSATLRAK